MNQTERIEAKARDIPILNKVLALQLQVVVLLPVPIDRQDHSGRTFDCHDVGQGNASRLAVLTHILIAGQIKINVDFQQHVPVVGVDLLFTRQLVLGALNLVPVRDGLRQINVTIEAHDLKLPNLVRMLPHDVRVAVGCLKIGGPIGSDKVLGRDVDRGRATKGRVEVDLLKCCPSQRESEQHPLVFTPVLGHLLGQNVVQVFLDPMSLPLALGRNPTHDLGLDRTPGREGLHDCLRLKANCRLRENGMEDATGSGPGARAIFNLQSEEVETLFVGLFPIFPGAAVRFKIIQEFMAQSAKVARVHVFSQIIMEPRHHLLRKLRPENDQSATVLRLNGDSIRVQNLNLKAAVRRIPQRAHRLINSHSQSPSQPYQ